MISNDTEGRKKIKLLLIEQYLEQYVKIFFYTYFTIKGIK